jgi:hypothetical protein
MKPPKRIQTASVRGVETPFDVFITSKKYNKKRYVALIST